MDANHEHAALLQSERSDVTDWPEAALHPASVAKVYGSVATTRHRRTTLGMSARAFLREPSVNGERASRFRA